MPLGFRSVLLVLVASLTFPALVSAEPGDYGYEGPVNTGVGGGATGEKPESKLWWNDGAWWAVMYSPSGSAHHIHRLDVATQQWIDTGVPVDPRESSRADVLWHDASGKLYIASRGVGGGRLLRFSYSSATDTYTNDAGAGTTTQLALITSSNPETLTLDRDSTGQLWAAWEIGNNVMVNRSLSSDTAWGAAFVLPVAGATGLDSDDIASVVAFDNSKIGVMWSNQNEDRMYFAVHLDSAADSTWEASSIAFGGAGNADDHINLKSLQADPDSDRVFAAIKTSRSDDPDPLVVLLRYDRSEGWWDAAVFGTDAEQHTRPQIMLDTSNRLVHVFATAPASGQTQTIYCKTTNMDAPRGLMTFPAGLGEPVLRDASGNLNDPTSSKQNVSNATGLVVMASGSGGRYWHHYNALATPGCNGVADPGGGPQPPAVPAGLAASPGDGQVDLSWNAVSGATEYHLKRATTSGGPYTTIASPTSPGHIDTNVTNGTTYYYVVSAENAAGESLDSAQVSATPSAGPQPPAVPAGLAASPGDGQVDLSWNAVSGATEYHLKRATTSGGPYTTIASPTSPGHIDTNVTNGTTYYYVVSAENAAGESLDSAQVSATPSAGGGGGTFPPSQDAYVKSASPTTTFNTGALQVRGGANKQYTFLQFDVGSSSGNATLRLFVSDASSASGNVYTVSSGWSEGSLTWSTMPGLGTQRAASQAAPAGTWVNFNLGPVGPGIVSLALANGVSDIVSFASSESANPPELIVAGGGGPQPPAVPAGLAASPGDGQVDLSWNAVSGATEYHLKRATTSGGPYTTIASPTSPGHIDTNVTNGTTYYYVVSAENAAGESLDSAQVSATPSAGGGGGTFPPSQDAYVKSASPTTTFNTGALQVRGGANKQYTFLQFDVGSSSGNATLRLFVSDASSASGNVYTVSSGWSEGSLTWSTMPGLGTQRAASQAAPAGTWVNFNLGPVGPGIVSLALANGVSDIVSFASSESANPPELIVDGG